MNSSLKLTEERLLNLFPLLLFYIILFLVGCAEQKPQGNVVARVNDQTLTLEMIYENSDASQALTSSDVRQYTNRWISNELLYQEARSRGYDAQEEIQKKIIEARKQLTISYLLDKEVYSISESTVRRDEIASYFQANSAEFTLKENIIRLSLAVFSDFESANKFRTQSLGTSGWDQSIELVRSNAAENLVTHSDSIFYSQSSLYPPELWKVASALGMFEVSFPVKTSAGFIVMRSLGMFRANTVAPLSYVETEIRRRIVMEQRQARYQQFLQSLRTKHTVQIMFPQSDSLGGN